MEIKLNLKEEEVNLLLQALGELPAKQSINIIMNIQNQIRPQFLANQQSIQNPIIKEVEKVEAEQVEPGKMKL